MTVYEKILNLSIEEMANFLANEGFTCHVCPNKPSCDRSCYDSCLIWLKTTAKEDTSYFHEIPVGTWFKSIKDDHLYIKIYDGYDKSNCFDLTENVLCDSIGPITVIPIKEDIKENLE